MELNAAVEKMEQVFHEINMEIPQKARNAILEIGRLDREVQKKNQEVQKLKMEFMANYETMTNDQKYRATNLLQAEMEKISDIADKKIAIAKEMKALMEKTKEKFDKEAKDFIENYEAPPPDASTTPGSTSSMSSPRSHRKKKMSDGDEDEMRTPTKPVEEKKRGRKRKEVKKEEDDEEEDQQMGEDEEETKMYCWCQLEKNDQMVYCENPLCKYEWFHFTCIGMVTAPVGHWFCTTECRDQAEEEEEKQKTEKKKGPPAQKKGKPQKKK